MGGERHLWAGAVSMVLLLIALVAIAWKLGLPTPLPVLRSAIETGFQASSSEGQPRPPR
jgi:hypothetical protein